jgi:exopolyphosphatase/guanosine-5'-triphosphate,3'-diphosphate pyrophosphatase
MSPSEGPVAVIDIGSNSARIVVYRLEAGLSTMILASSRGSLRLVRDLGASHKLSRDAQERAYDVLQDFRALALGAGATKTIALATSAIRDAENGKGFIAEIEKRFGFEARILSGEDEARYGFLGAVGGLPVDHGALFDLGGGSMQVTRFRQRKIVGAVSLPLGSLRLSDAFLKSDPPTSGEQRKLVDHARALLEKAKVAPLQPGESLVGTGGTVRNLAKIDLRSRNYPVSRLHGYGLTRKHLKDVVELVASRKLKRRVEIPGLNADRGDSIVGGALAILSLVQTLEADEIWVSGQGVREGLARSLSSEALPAPADVRQASVFALASRFNGWDEAAARRRASIAESLSGALDLAAEPALKEALLHAAILLDVGRSVDYFDRHEHVADIVLDTDLLGFSHRGIALLSAVARAAGDEDAKPHPLSPLVTANDEDGIRRAGTLLALADDIEERCPKDAAVTVECRTDRDDVVVTVQPLAGWRPRMLGKRFERAFDRKLTVVPVPSPGPS